MFCATWRLCESPSPNLPLSGLRYLRASKLKSTWACRRLSSRIACPLECWTCLLGIHHHIEISRASLRLMMSWGRSVHCLSCRKGIRDSSHCFPNCIQPCKLCGIFHPSPHIVHHHHKLCRAWPDWPFAVASRTHLRPFPLALGHHLSEWYLSLR